MMHKNLVLQNSYIISYVFFVFTEFLCKDSQFAGNGGIQQNITASPLATYIYYVVLFFSIVINIYIYISLNFTKNLSNFMFLLILLLLFVLMLAKILFITPFLFVFFLFAINLNIVNFHQFIKYDFFIRVFSIGLIFLLHIFNLFPSTMGTITRGNELRLSLGFNNPNELGVAILTLFLSGFAFMQFLNRRNYVAFTVLFGLIYIYISKVSDSRGFEICGIILFISMIFVKLKYWNKLCKYLSVPIIFISLLLYIYMSIYMDTSTHIYNIINEYSSNRLLDQARALSLYPPKLSGYSNLFMLSSKSIYGPTPVDNLYSTLLLKCGIIGFIIYEIVFSYLPFLLMKVKSHYMYIYIIIFAIAAFTGYSSDLMIIFLIIYSYYFSKVNR